VSASELAQRPEAHLYFPGSTVLQTTSQDMTGPLFSAGEPTDVSTRLATTTSQGDVIRWYERQMGSRGWSPACGEVCIRTAPEWSRGNREVFTLYFVDQTSPDYKITSLPTEYEVSHYLAAHLGIDELYCLVFRPPHYTGSPTGQRFLC
jgi:hypothetical protein